MKFLIFLSALVVVTLAENKSETTTVNAGEKTTPELSNVHLIQNQKQNVQFMSHRYNNGYNYGEETQSYRKHDYIIKCYKNEDNHYRCKYNGKKYDANMLYNEKCNEIYNYNYNNDLCQLFDEIFDDIELKCNNYGECSYGKKKYIVDELYDKCRKHDHKDDDLCRQFYQWLSKHRNFQQQRPSNY